MSSIINSLSSNLFPQDRTFNTVDNFDAFDRSDKENPIFRIVIIKKRSVDYGKEIVNVFTEFNNDSIINIEVNNSFFANDSPEVNMWDKGGRAVLLIDTKRGAPLNPTYKDLSNIKDKSYKKTFADVEEGDMIQIFLGYRMKYRGVVPRPLLGGAMTNMIGHSSNVGIGSSNLQRAAYEYCAFIGTIGSIRYYRNNNGEYAYVRCHSLENFLNYSKITRNFTNSMIETEDGKDGLEESNKTTVNIALKSIYETVKAMISYNYPFMKVHYYDYDLDGSYKEQKVTGSTLTGVPLWTVLKEFPRKFMNVEKDDFIQIFLKPDFYNKERGFYTSVNLVVRNLKGRNYVLNNIGCLAGQLDINETINNPSDITKSIFTEPNILRLSTFNNLSNVFNVILVVSLFKAYIYPYIPELFYGDLKAHTLITGNVVNIENGTIDKREIIKLEETDEEFKNKIIENVEKHGIRIMPINSEFLEQHAGGIHTDDNLKVILKKVLHEVLKKKKKGELALLGDPRINIYDTLLDVKNLPLIREENITDSLMHKSNKYKKITSKLMYKDYLEADKYGNKSYEFSNASGLIPVIITHLFNREEGFRTLVSFHENRDSLAKRYSMLINAIMGNMIYNKHSIDNTFQDSGTDLISFTLLDGNPANTENNKRMGIFLNRLIKDKTVTYAGVSKFQYETDKGERVTRELAFPYGEMPSVEITGEERRLPEVETQTVTIKPSGKEKIMGGEYGEGGIGLGKLSPSTLRLLTKEYKKHYPYKPESFGVDETTARFTGTPAQEYRAATKEDLKKYGVELGFEVPSLEEFIKRGTDIGKLGKMVSKKLIEPLKPIIPVHEMKKEKDVFTGAVKRDELTTKYDDTLVDKIMKEMGVDESSPLFEEQKKQVIKDIKEHVPKYQAPGSKQIMTLHGRVIRAGIGGRTVYTVKTTDKEELKNMIKQFDAEGSEEEE